MKALVVGGTGFVGMNVVRALVRAGHDVIATRRNRANTLFARRLGARLEVAELDDPDSLVRAMTGREVVFMCAGHYPRFSLDLDAETSFARRQIRTTLDAARTAGVRRFVFTSSIATVGPPREGRSLSNETDPPSKAALDSVYIAVKNTLESEVLQAHGRGLDCVVLCPTGIVGELDVKVGTGFVIVALAHGRLPFYIDGPTNVVDADDLALAHVVAAERGRSGERYIVNGHNLSVREMLDAVSEELGIPVRAARLPLGLAGPLATFDELRCSAKGRGARPFMAREFVDIVRHGQRVDRSKGAIELGLPAPTPLMTTLRKACRWYGRHGYLPKPESNEARP
ncbi:MAG TPA: NAD-dependent epimerase/dehydratase family protein [Polyangiaceae bacterium]|nr:NAD-dependent epimerase/dehydratase family protein [Polyangiaceae bacterium]